MTYRTENKVKANFDDAYRQPTPHDYVRKMALHAYQIGDRTRPYCIAAAELLKERNAEAWPLQMLDVGCSYGMGSAFIRYECSFDEIVSFFASRAPVEYYLCCAAMRKWLNVIPPARDMRCVGMDSAAPAIQFGLDAGLLDGGIGRNLEDPDVHPTKTDLQWFRSSNLLVSTGAIGYVTETTLSKVLPHLGQDHPDGFGPLAVVSILRMFEVEPIASAFERSGLRLTSVPGVRLPQRNFVDQAEQISVCRLLHERGINTSNYEDEGKLYADLFVAAPAEQLSELVETMKLAQSQTSFAEELLYSHR